MSHALLGQDVSLHLFAMVTGVNKVGDFETGPFFLAPYA